MNVPVHRDTDSRVCGASTTVTGQNNVYVNNLLASVQGDPNTHGSGNLGATVNDGTVFVNNKKLVLQGSSASPDKKFPPLGPPHNNPKAVGASPNVFACNGSAGQGGTRNGSFGGGSSAGGGASGAVSGGSANPPPVDPNISEVNINTEGFCKGVDVYNRLIDDGYSPDAAAGIVGNLLHESDQFRADTEYGGGGGRGWLQWTGGRRVNFEQYAAANGVEPVTDTANYNFLNYELDGGTGNHWGRGYSLEEYKQITDPSEAAEYFMRGYTRPAEATANLAARQEYARRLRSGDHNCGGTLT